MRNLNKIFIIEDDLNILYGLRDIFSSNDFEVDLSDSKNSAEDILKKIRLFRPDSIILDMTLPGLDGEDLIKGIKSDEKISDAEIFIFSDLSDEDGRSRSANLGANYYFMKNEFDIQTFAAKVMRVMDGEHLMSQEEKDEEESDDLLVMD